MATKYGHKIENKRRVRRRIKKNDRVNNNIMNAYKQMAGVTAASRLFHNSRVKITLQQKQQQQQRHQQPPSLSCVRYLLVDLVVSFVSIFFRMCASISLFISCLSRCWFWFGFWFRHLLIFFSQRCCLCVLDVVVVVFFWHVFIIFGQMSNIYICSRAFDVAVIFTLISCTCSYMDSED